MSRRRYELEEGGCRGDRRLEVLGEPAVPVEPCEGALDHPAARMDDEAGLIGDAADDLHVDAGGVGHAFGVVALSAKALATNGWRERDVLSSGTATSRSCTSAGWMSRPSGRPSVSTMAWRLRPFTFLAAS